MIITRIQMKNFKIFKNVDIDLSNTQSGIVLFVGTGGVGKTTIIDAFHWALFGEINTRIKSLMDLINYEAQQSTRVGEVVDAFVKIDFVQDNNLYRVCRSLRAMKHLGERFEVEESKFVCQVKEDGAVEYINENRIHFPYTKFYSWISTDIEIYKSDFDRNLALISRLETLEKALKYCKFTQKKFQNYAHEFESNEFLSERHRKLKMASDYTDEIISRFSDKLESGKLQAKTDIEQEFGNIVRELYMRDVSISLDDFFDGKLRYCGELEEMTTQMKIICKIAFVLACRLERNRIALVNEDNEQKKGEVLFIDHIPGYIPKHIIKKLVQHIENQNDQIIICTASEKEFKADKKKAIFYIETEEGCFGTSAVVRKEY